MNRQRQRRFQGDRSSLNSFKGRFNLIQCRINVLVVWKFVLLLMHVGFEHFRFLFVLFLHFFYTLPLCNTFRSTLIFRFCNMHQGCTEIVHRSVPRGILYLESKNHLSSNSMIQRICKYSCVCLSVGGTYCGQNLNSICHRIIHCMHYVVMKLLLAIVPLEIHLKSRIL